MYYLKDNVFRVKGEYRDAIYNFNNNVLYYLSHDAKKLFDKIQDKPTVKMSHEEKEFFQSLMQMDIMTEVYTEEHSIKDLKKEFCIDFVWIEVTTGCNLQCKHCYDEASANSFKHMNFEDFTHIIDELVMNKITKLQIIGGEPFVLGNELYKYLNYCIGKFEYLEIFTNATLLDEEWSQYIKDNNIKIAVSVYSYDENEHNNVTKNKESFRRTNNSIKSMREKGISYRVRNVLMSGLELGEKNTELYQLSKKRDIVRMVGRANLKLLDDRLLRKKLITYDKFTAKLNKELVTRIVSGHNCFERRLYFSVDSEVYPCVMERRISHGNIKNTRLHDILSPQIRNMNKDKIIGCNKCEFRYTCFDCRPDALNGGIYEKPWYCTYEPETGLWVDIDEFVERIKML